MPSKHPSGVVFCLYSETKSFIFLGFSSCFMVLNHFNHVCGVYASLDSHHTHHMAHKALKNYVQFLQNTLLEWYFHSQK